MKLIFTILTSVFAAQGSAAKHSIDEQLGSVLGQAVMASQLGATTGYEREQKMRSLFVRPLLSNWKHHHPDAVTPTAREEAEALACARKALASSKKTGTHITPQQLVDFQLPFWKFEQSIYRAYGGGSTLFQQRGIEAYGAMRRFLENAESKGQLSFKSQAVRKTVYAYWNLGEDDPRVQSGPEHSAYFDTPPPCTSDAARPPAL
ncbi:MAG: hypothetical protein WCD66_06825 [Rhodanobacteraceae bacterium]